MKLILFTCLFLAGSLAGFSQKTARDSLEELNELKKDRAAVKVRMDSLQVATDKVEVLLGETNKRLEELKAAARDSIKTSVKNKDKKNELLRESQESLKKRLNENKAVLSECRELLKEFDDMIKRFQKT